MSLIHGKQLRGNSIRLDKFDFAASQGDYTYQTGTRLGQVDAPVNATDYANKAYVDAARSGMDWKDSVAVSTVANITLSGTQTIDGYAAGVGERVLVSFQTAGADNGIWVVAAGAWSRATDADNSGSGSEVTSGMFAFVENGTRGGRGYVLTTPNPIVLGTTVLTFVQFTSAGSYTSGDGLLVSGQVISIQLIANSGLTVSGSGLGVNSSIAGTGLAFSAGVISVNAIPLGDNSRVSGVLSSTNGGTGSNIDPATITNGMLLIGHAANDRFQTATLTAGDAIAITNAAAAITVSVPDNSITHSKLDIGAPVTGRVIGWNGSSLVWVTNPDNQQISGTNNNNGTYTVNLTGDSASNFTINFSQVLDDLSVDVFSDVTISGASVGQVLRYSGAAWMNAVLAAADVSYNPAGTSLSAITAQAAITELSTALDAIDVAIMSIVNTDKGQVSQTAGNDQFSGATISTHPLGYVIVLINGIFYRVEGNKSGGECYFTGDNGTTARALNNVQAGDKLYWLATNAGFSLDTSDVIDLVYET